MIEAAKARYKERHKEEIKLLLKSGVTAEEIDNSIQSLYDSGEISMEDIVYRLKQIRPEITYSWDDKGISELFASLYRDFCRYNVTAKEWFVFDGKVWKADTGAMRVSQKAKEFANALLVYSTSIEDERQKTDYIKKITSYGQLRYRETLIKDARDKYYISQTDLDKNLDLFNCQMAHTI